MVSFPHASPSKSCTQLSPPHICCISHRSHSSLFDHPQHLVRSTDHKAPRYVVFSTPLIPRASYMAAKFQLILLASHISQHTLFTFYFIMAVVPYEIPSKVVLLIYLFRPSVEYYRSLRSCTRICGVCRVNKGDWITVGNCERSNSALILLHLWAVRGKTHRHFLLHSYCVVFYLEERLAHVKSDTGQKNIPYVLFRDLLSRTVLLSDLTKLYERKGCNYLCI